MMAWVLLWKVRTGSARRGPMVRLYALAIFGYGLSVDWLAWGMQRFAVMSGARAMVAVINVTFTIVCVVGFHAGLLIIPLLRLRWPMLSQERPSGCSRREGS